MSGKAFLLACFLSVAVGPFPVMAAEGDGSQGKGYLDLLKEEKALLRTLTFNRKQCFFAKAREADNGTVLPQVLAKSLAKECSEHEAIIRSLLKGRLGMNEEFIHDYIRTIQEDVLTSMVPYIIKHRKEERQKKGELW